MNAAASEIPIGGDAGRLCCSVCGPGQESVAYRELDGWQYRRCAGCGVVFLATDRNAQDQFYADSLSKLAHRNETTKHAIEYWSMPDLFAKHRPVFEHYFADRLRQLRSAGYQDGGLLDIGCGYGFFVKYLRDLGIDAKGIDTAAEQVAWSNREWNLGLACAAVEDFQAEKKFAAVVMADVLEHVWNPVAVLRRVRDFLAPGGLLAIQVPNLLGFKVPPGHSWGVPHHLWQFERATLLRVLEESGYQEVSWSTGVLGVIGMHERGGPTLREKMYLWLAGTCKIGNRLLVICRKED